jgi:hypothetical protein
MTPQNSPIHAAQAPHNAEHEIRKAYNCVIESNVTYFKRQTEINGVNPNEVERLYRHSFDCLQKGNFLAAERWARSAKHLARAFWHEAKIAYLEPRIDEIPFIEGATDVEYNLHERIDTTTDLLDSASIPIASAPNTTQKQMSHYLSQARQHLKIIENIGYQNELLKAERIKAAHEYGRTLECISLAHEAEDPDKKVA